MGSINQEKERFWRAQLAGAERRNGSMGEYCRERGISASALAYWKRKLERGYQSKAIVPSGFVPVQISRVEKRELPDAKWLASFILHLSGECR